MPNNSSQRTELIIVIIQLKVKKLLTRNLLPVMYQSCTYCPSSFSQRADKHFPMSGGFSTFQWPSGKLF